MKSIIRGLTFALAMTGILSKTPAETPAASYLRHPATTIAQLIHQVESDDSIANKYIRHFMMEKKELIPYLSSLTLTKLKDDTIVGLYFQDGKKIFTRLKKGALVWADLSGKPILKWYWGNPVSKGPRGEDLLEASALAEDDPLPVPDQAVGEIVDSSENIDSIRDAMEPSLLIDGDTTEYIDEYDSCCNSCGGYGDSSGAGKWGYLGALGLFGLLGLGGGGDHDDNTTTIIQNGNTPVVPEPMTILSLSAGIGYLVRLRRRKASL